MGSQDVLRFIEIVRREMTMDAEVTVFCDECGCSISQKESCFCESCVEGFKAEISELTDKIVELNNLVISLQKEIDREK